MELNESSKHSIKSDYSDAKRREYIARYHSEYSDGNGEIVWEKLYKDMIPITREEMDRQICEMRDARKRLTDCDADPEFSI
jgi:hypothetical protein